jgi:ABC-2 type transport system ATP-binding protein
MPSRLRSVPDLKTVITTDRLTKSYGPLAAVDAVSMSVFEREIIGLIGPNGAGKSTLIKMLTTLLPPSSGDALVAGYSIMKAPAKVRAHIGYVPQLLSSDGNLTGYENLLMSARLYLVPHREREGRISAALALMELTDARDRLVQHYSGGMIRRLEIAQAMLNEPAVLFLDEPTVGLDPVARHSIWKHMRDLRDRVGMTILMATHQMDEAEALCDRIAIMHSGLLQRIGTPEALKAELSPTASLDDVFAAITGTGLSEEGSLRLVQQARLSEHAHA